MAATVTPRLATLFDQALVSATGFLAMLYFARHLPEMDWAIFSFAAGLLLVLQGIQINAVTIPMITFCHGAPIGAAEQQNWTWLNRTISAALLGVSVLAGLAFRQSNVSWIAESLFYTAILIPPAFAYEYLRRRLIVNQQYRKLLVASIAYAAGVAMGILANVVLNCSPLLAALSFWPGMWLALLVCRLHDPIRISAPNADWFKPLRAFAPAAVGSSLAGTGYNFAVLAILGVLAGPLAVALFNATRIFMQPINTLVGAFSSLDIPRAARAYAESGRALFNIQVRAIARLVVIGGTYLIVLCLATEKLLYWVFAGRYGSEAMVWAWCLVGLTMLLATPAETAFYVTRQTRLLFLSKLLASFVACGLAYVFIPSMGAVGAVLSTATGWMMSFIGAAALLCRTRVKPTPMHLVGI